MTDEEWMRQALLLARQGKGWVEPNPMVGAVVVKEHRCLGQGWHQQFGGPHAERHALAEAGDAARGATVYVTLEPCCHHGKTPPCTDALIDAGVSRVVAAMADPFPRVAGGGIQLLRQAGIQVEIGCLENEARELNAPYLKLLSTGKPWILAKWAMTLDGRIATRTGDSQWISNETSRKVVHRIRGEVDGILVGIATALADDPRLTARPPGPRTPTRIVLDSRLRLPMSSQLVQTAREVPTLLVTSDQSSPEDRRQREDQGCEILIVPTRENHRLDLTVLLDELGRRRFTNLLVEGGGEVLGSLHDDGLIDEVHVFVAPRLMGGKHAFSPVLGQGVGAIEDMLQLTGVETELLDGDIHIRGRRALPQPPSSFHKRSK